MRFKLTLLIMAPLLLFYLQQQGIASIHDVQIACAVKSHRGKISGSIIGRPENTDIRSGSCGRIDPVKKQVKVDFVL